MAMREEEAGRSVSRLPADDEFDLAPQAPASPAPRPKRLGSPLTAYRSADDLYAALAAQRQANLEKLAESTAPAADPGPAPPKPSGGRVLGWSLLAGLAAAVAVLRRK